MARQPIDRVSVVCPVYCADPETLRELHRRIGLAAQRAEVDVELVLVDDASPDSTWSTLTDLARSDGRVVALRLERNVRQTRAIFAGLEAASSDFFVVMDADLEHPPEAIGELIDACRAGSDLVVATRRRRSIPVWRRAGSIAANLLTRAAGHPVPDLGSSFMALDRAVEAGLRAELDRSGVQLLLPHAFRISRDPAVVEIDAGDRAPSHYSAVTVLRIGLGFVARFAARRLAAVCGIATLLALLRLARADRRGTAAWWVVAAGGLLTTWLAWLPTRRRPDHRRPLYVVSERVGPSAGTSGAPAR